MGHNEDNWLIQEFTRQVVEEAAKGNGKELLRELQDGLAKTAQTETRRLENCIEAVGKQVKATEVHIPAKTNELLRVMQEGLAQTARTETRRLEKRIDAVGQQFGSAETILEKTTEKLTFLLQNKASAADVSEIKKALTKLQTDLDSMQKSLSGINAILGSTKGFGPTVVHSTAPVTLPNPESQVTTQSSWGWVCSHPYVVLIEVVLITLCLGLGYYSQIVQRKPTTVAQEIKPTPPIAPKELKRLLEQRVDSVEACSEEQDVVMRNCLRKLGVSLEKETIAELVGNVAASPKKAEASAILLQAVSKTLGNNGALPIDGHLGKRSLAALDKLPCVAARYNNTPIPQNSPPETLLKEILPACASDLTKSAP